MRHVGDMGHIVYMHKEVKVGSSSPSAGLSASCAPRDDTVGIPESRPQHARHIIIIYAQ